MWIMTGSVGESVGRTETLSHTFDHFSETLNFLQRKFNFFFVVVMCLGHTQQGSGLTPNSALRYYSWQVWETIWVPGNRSASAVCRARTLPAVLWL